MEHSACSDLNALKKTFGTADYVAPYTIFDVGGWRKQVSYHHAIHYNRERVYVRKVLTHAEYDQWSADMRRGRTRRGSK